MLCHQSLNILKANYDSTKLLIRFFCRQECNPNAIFVAYDVLEECDRKEGDHI